MIQRIFHLKSERQRTLRLLFGDCRHNYFHSLTKLAFPLSKGQLCLYDKQNITWLLTDMEFLFSCSTRREIPYLRALMHYSLCIVEITISPLMTGGEGHLQKEREKISTLETRFKRWLSRSK